MILNNFNTLFREFYIFYHKNINEEDYQVKAKVFFYNLKSYPEQQIKSIFMDFMSAGERYLPNLKVIKEKLSSTQYNSESLSSCELCRSTPGLVTMIIGKKYNKEKNTVEDVVKYLWSMSNQARTNELYNQDGIRYYNYTYACSCHTGQQMRDQRNLPQVNT